MSIPRAQSNCMPLFEYERLNIIIMTNKENMWSCTFFLIINYYPFIGRSVFTCLRI